MINLMGHKKKILYDFILDSDSPAKRHKKLDLFK